jgi:hypothetical protein
VRAPACSWAPEASKRAANPENTASSWSISGRNASSCSPAASPARAELSMAATAATASPSRPHTFAGFSACFVHMFEF